MTTQGWSVSDHISTSTANPGSGNQLFPLVVAALVLAALTFFMPNWKHNPLQVKWLFASALGLLGIAYLFADARRNRLRFDAVDAAAVLLLIWIGISIAWSPDRLAGYEVLIKWTMLTSALIGLRRMVDSVARPVAIAVATGLLLTMMIELLGIVKGSHGGYYNQNFQTEAMLFGMPLLVVLMTNDAPRWQYFSAATVLIASALYLLFINPSKIEFLVWATTGLFFAMALLWRRSKPAALACVLAIVGVTATLLVLGWEKPLFGASHGFRLSVYPRLELALNGLMIWRDAPLFGHGAGYLYPVYPIYQERHLALLGTDYDSGAFASFYKVLGQLHNEYIQFLDAFGLVGIAIVILGIYAARKRLQQWRNSPTGIAGLAVLLACAANSWVEFPLQNPTTAILAIVGLAFLIPATPAAPDNTVGSSGKVAVLLLVVLIVATPLTAWWGYRFFIGHDAYSLAFRVVGEGSAETSVTLNLAATKAYPLDEHFRFQLYPTLMHLQENSGGRQIDPRIHDEFFATSLTAGMNNAVMIFRLEYLLDSRRYRQLPDEVARWRRQLTTNSTRLADTWIMEALYELAGDNPKGARAAVDHYLALTRGQIEEHRVHLLSDIRDELPPELRW